MMILMAGGITSIALENTIEEWIYENTGATVEFDAAESVDILEKVNGGIYTYFKSNTGE